MEEITGHHDNTTVFGPGAVSSSDFMEIVSSLPAYKIGSIIAKYYFRIFVPFGIMGNILSFLVMVQPHNRQRAMSWYLASIAVVDSLVLSGSFVTHLATQAGVRWPPGPFWFCTFICTLNFFSILCSTMLVVSMTFDRFYSILMPLMAASFNTVKRAKITIICIYLFALAYNIPQALLVDGETYQCVPYGKVDQIPYSMVYYWFSFVINYALPFILLLSMNSVIIHKIRQRKFRNNPDAGPSQVQGQGQPRRSSEGQTFAILVLVTFTLLILTTPAYMFFIYIQVVNYTASPESFASYFLFYHSSFALQVTNYGINFFLYVISGKKFRMDLMGLFRMKNRQHEHTSAKETPPP